MSTQIVKQEEQERLGRVLTTGNLALLTEEERLWYYHRMCEYIGVDPIIKPFDLLETPGRPAAPKKDGSGEMWPERPAIISLYPNAKMAGFLINRHRLNARIVDERLHSNNIYTVRYRVEDASGRYVEASGVVDVRNLSGDALANAMMKAETKAFRRAVLRKVGLTMTDESEMETVPGTRRYDIDVETGVIAPSVAPPQITGPVLQQVAAAAAVPSVPASKPADNGGIFADVTDIPDTLPTGASAFVALVDQARAKLGRAPYGQPVVLHGLLKRDMPDGFDWGMLKDPGAARVAYRIAVEHIRASEAD